MLRNINNIFTSTWKESLLLRRDKTGLMVLFMMPAILVVIITLVQENVMELTGEKQTQVLFLDEDQGLVGEKMQKAFLGSSRITLVKLDHLKQSRKEAVNKVLRGDYQVCVIVPAKTTENLEKKIQSLFSPGIQSIQKEKLTDTLLVYFAPGILPGFRSGILAVLQMAVADIEMEIKIRAFEKRSEKLLKDVSLLMEMQGEKLDLGLEQLKQSVLSITESDVGAVGKAQSISAVQHNIPSWSLFGLFFTAIPLAGSLLMERNSGIWRRLLTMPASPVTLLIGKIVAYIGVCFSQLLLIVLIGRFLFPHLGLPAFTVSGSFPALLIIILCCSLAACGYGILLGSACSTIEQASMFGSISIVVAAALGGIMAPVYAMPGIMQKISVVSPLNWGLTSFQDILIRGYSLADTADNLARLLLFFLVTLLVSWKLTRSFS